MNYIIFKSDGSIKETNFTEVINQNSNEVNQIFVSSEGIDDIDDYSLVGIFVLPDGSTSEVVGVATEDVEYQDGQTANGYILTLTQNETFIPGIVLLTLQINEDDTQKTLYTYRVALTINETANLSSLTLISLAQYNALKTYIDTNFLKKTSATSYYVPYTGAIKAVDLGVYRIKAGSFASVNGKTTYGEHYISNQWGANDNVTFIFPQKRGSVEYETFATEGWAEENIKPQKKVIGVFNTSSFSRPDETNYVLNNIPLSGFITGSDLLIITWGNCFAICPIPESGAGRVCAAMWNANGEAQTIRIRYELKDDNTKLDIALQGGFTPPLNFTGYVINYKIA